VKPIGKVKAASAAFSFLEGNLKSNKWDGIPICERSLRLTAHFTRAMSCKRVRNAGAASAGESVGITSAEPKAGASTSQGHLLRYWLGHAQDDIELGFWVRQLARLSHLLLC
jgi:hypothetical protein